MALVELHEADLMLMPTQAPGTVFFPFARHDLLTSRWVTPGPSATLCSKTDTEQNAHHICLLKPAFSSQGCARDYHGRTCPPFFPLTPAILSVKLAAPGRFSGELLLSLLILDAPNGNFDKSTFPPHRMTAMRLTPCSDANFLNRSEVTTATPVPALGSTHCERHGVRLRSNKWKHRLAKPSTHQLHFLPYQPHACDNLFL